MLLSCWSKSIVQAELARYVIISGDTYLRALNRLPGRIPTRHGGIAWPILLGLVGFIPFLLTMGGIVGGASQGLQLLIGFDAVTNTALVALAVMALLGTGAYLRLERSMIALVMSFTLITLVCAVTMQFSDYAVSLPDLASGLRFDFPLEFAVLALAMYGFTGVNSSESASYTYWCIEKGWPSHIGADRNDPGWLDRARGWIRVLHTDVWATLIILTLATLPFYLLGAGVLHRSGAAPSGLDTIRTLSAMFTDVLGNWSLWLFGCGAFLIFFSTALSGIAAGGRFIPDYAIELGFLNRHRVNRRHWIRGYVLIVPVTSFILYLTFESPVLLVTHRRRHRRPLPAPAKRRHPVAAEPLPRPPGKPRRLGEGRPLGGIRLPVGDGRGGDLVRDSVSGLGAPNCRLKPPSTSVGQWRLGSPRSGAGARPSRGGPRAGCRRAGRGPSASAGLPSLRRRPARFATERVPHFDGVRRT